MNVELPDNFSPELKHLLESLLQVKILLIFKSIKLSVVFLERCGQKTWLWGAWGGGTEDSSLLHRSGLGAGVPTKIPPTPDSAEGGGQCG